jgi:transposase
MTFIAGLRHDGMVAPFVIDGAMNGATFLASIEQALAPTLQPDDIVIIDSTSIHKVSRRRRSYRSCRSETVLSPPVLARFPPIEVALSKLKALLRKAAERTVPNLRRRIAKLLPCFTATECANFLAHAGYASK